MCAERKILLVEGHGQRTVEDHAKDVLGRFVDKAVQQGINADRVLTITLPKTEEGKARKVMVKG